MKIPTFLMCLSMTLMSSFSEQSLKIKINDLQYDLGGDIIVKVFDKSIKNPYGIVVPIYQQKIAVEFFEAYTEIEGLPHGEYVVAIFHDVNQNGVLDKNPKLYGQEGYAFSNQKSCKELPKITKKHFFRFNDMFNEIEVFLCYN